MADRKLMEEYENSVMSLAISEMLEEYGRELIEKSKTMEDVKPSKEAAAKFEAALSREYRKGQIKAMRRNAAKAIRYVVTACAALIIVFSISIVSVDAVRFKFLDWLTHIHPTYTSYNNQVNDLVMPSNIPDGYSMQFFSKDDVSVTETLSNGESFITIVINANQITVNVDNEETESELVEIGDWVGSFIIKEDMSMLLLNANDKSYIITTNDSQITKEEIVNIAKSLL